MKLVANLLMTIHNVAAAEGILLGARSGLDPATVVKVIGEALLDTGSPAPLFSATIPIYTAALTSGHADHDTATVYEVLERMSGLNPHAS